MARTIIASSFALRGQDLVTHLARGAKFDVLKGREAWFRDWDHQLLQTMYVVKVKDKGEMRDPWDIFDIVEAQPARGDSLELIQPTRAENPCRMPEV